jgi:GNAT superfamily N-acetyltransferase
VSALYSTTDSSTAGLVRHTMVVKMSPPKITCQIRLAIAGEAHLLSELASRAKAYWPYDEEYLRLCRSVVHVTPEDIQRWPFKVAVEGESLCGFVAVCAVEGERMLDHLWIDPPYIGRGLGRILFMEGVASAREMGWTRFTIASDPYAEGFYLKMGAKRIGERESKIKKSLFLPLLEFSPT